MQENQLFHSISFAWEWKNYILPFRYCRAKLSQEIGNRHKGGWVYRIYGRRTTTLSFIYTPVSIAGLERGDDKRTQLQAIPPIGIRYRTVKAEVIENCAKMFRISPLRTRGRNTARRSSFGPELGQRKRKNTMDLTRRGNSNVLARISIISIFRASSYATTVFS